MMRVYGPGAWEDAARWLDTVRIPVRLGVTSKAGPRVVSLWYLRDGDTLWCATQKDAALIGFLAHNTAVGYEVAADGPPYRGVRGTAEAHLDVARGPDMIEQLIARYLTDKNARLANWLQARRDDEVAICLTLKTVVTWDFSARMVPEDPTWLIPDGASPSPLD
jgi:hypothetical protein